LTAIGVPSAFFKKKRRGEGATLPAALNARPLFYFFSSAAA
jgi:hypothetical protein